MLKTDSDVYKRQVHDVDVVADARPVGRRVVVAEDREALAQSGGGLRDEGGRKSLYLLWAASHKVGCRSFRR